MTTGRFDPYAGLRARVEAQLAQEREATATPREQIVLSSADAGKPEHQRKVKEFIARAQEQTQERRARREELFEQAMAEWPCEGVFAKHLLRLWRETVWVERTGQFANGRPLDEQFEPELRVIETFLAAIVRRENYRMEQAEKGMPEGAPGPGAGREPPPVDGEEWH